MQKLNKNIIEWAKERGIDKSGTVEAQAIKTIEEMSELIKGICKDDIDLIKDSIGDVYVTLVIGCMLTYKNDETVLNILELEKEKDFDYYTFYDDKKTRLLMGLTMLNTFGNQYCGNTSYWLETLMTCRRVLKHTAKDHNTTLEECVELAYNEIKNRKGKMIAGQFVKESDLK